MASSPPLRLAVAFVLLVSFPDVAAYMCHRTSVFGLDTYTYCYYGCCGDYDYQYCCSSPYRVKYIVGGTVGGIAIVVGLIALCCWCCCRAAARTSTVTTATTTAAPIVYSSSSTMQMGGATYPVQPQPYPGGHGYGYPPSYDQATTSGLANPNYVKY